MLARRDTQREAARLRHLSPLQTLEAQSQTWGIHCHSCTLREGLSPSWPLSYKTYVVAVYPRIQVLFQPTDRTDPSMELVNVDGDLVGEVVHYVPHVHLDGG